MGGGSLQYGHTVSIPTPYFRRCVIVLVFSRSCKPQVLTAAGIVKKEYSALFVPVNRSARSPDGTPCRKSTVSISLSYLTLSKFRRSGAIPAGLCVHVLDSK